MKIHKYTYSFTTYIFVTAIGDKQQFKNSKFYYFYNNEVRDHETKWPMRGRICSLVKVHMALDFLIVFP